MRTAGVRQARAAAVPVRRLRKASVGLECGQGGAAAGLRTCVG